MKVFLGGTCNGSLWRDELIPMVPNCDCFNPVVPDWNEEAYQRELHEREVCDKMLYVITPKMQGVYSIAELVEDSIQRSDKCVFCYLESYEGETFEPHVIKSLKATGKMVAKYGVPVCTSLEQVAKILDVGSDVQSSFDKAMNMMAMK